MKRKADAQPGGDSKRRKTKESPNTTLATKVRKLENSVASLKSESELKVQIQTNSGNLSPQSSYFTTENCVSRVTQGIAGNNRIGTRISCQGLYLKMNLRSRTAEITDPTIIRCIVFVDKNPGTGVSTAPVLNSLVSPNGLLDNSFGSISVCNTNWVARNRYKILYDKVFVLNPQTILDYDPTTGNTSLMFPVTQFYKKWIPLNDMPITYNGSGGASTDISSNNIWLWFGQSATPSAVGATVEYQSRLYFKDA